MTAAESATPDEDGPTHHEGLEHETIEDVQAEKALLAKAIGGWRGLFDSGAPAALFVIAYLVTDSNLSLAIWIAVGAGALVLMWRLIRRESLQQVLAGFAGVAVSAFVASRTGRAEDFFLPGLITNIAYGTAFVVSIAIRWPLIGVVVGLLTSGGTSWRHDPPLRRAYAAASWVWVGVFLGRLVVQVPLYLAGAVGALGAARIVMGWPLFLAAAYVTYRILKPTLSARR
ncbi:MAG: DUF3159 domain-containing protein [Actinomycetes bacterium]